VTDCFIGEIRLVAFDRVPSGWMSCQGQLLPIAQYQALFVILGTQYGGNGTTNFALPDLRGVVPLSWDPEHFPVAGRGGAAQVTLTQVNLPSHSHGLTASSATGSTPSPQNALFAAPRVGRAAQPAYSASPAVTTAGDTLGLVGGAQAHNNLQPYLTLNFIIAYDGVFPARE
jgi:microcystin-dependent protein